MKLNNKLILPISLLVIGLLLIVFGLLIITADFTLQMPNLVGESKDLAIARLQEIDLSVSESYDFDPNQEEGLVLRQDITAGDAVAVGTEVKLVINKAPDVKYVTVPKLTDMTEQAARDELIGLGLAVGSSKYMFSGERPDHTVLSQSVEHGSELLAGDEISLTVSTINPAEATVMHSFLEMHWRSCTQCIYEMGIPFILKQIDHETPNLGTVQAQNLPEGTEITKDSNLTLMLCKLSTNSPDGRSTMPNLENWDMNEALSILLELGCDVIVKYGDDRSTSYGTVLSQSLEPSKKLDEGELVELIIRREGAEPYDPKIDPFGPSGTPGTDVPPTQPDKSETDKPAEEGETPNGGNPPAEGETPIIDNPPVESGKTEGDVNT